MTYILQDNWSIIRLSLYDCDDVQPVCYDAWPAALSSLGSLPCLPHSHSNLLHWLLSRLFWRWPLFDSIFAPINYSLCLTVGPCEILEVGPDQITDNIEWYDERFDYTVRVLSLNLLFRVRFYSQGYSERTCYLGDRDQNIGGENGLFDALNTILGTTSTILSIFNETSDAISIPLPTMVLEVLINREKKYISLLTMSPYNKRNVAL